MEDNTMFTLGNITHRTDGPDGPTESPRHTFVKIQGRGNHGFQMGNVGPSNESRYANLNLVNNDVYHLGDYSSLDAKQEDFRLKEEALRSSPQ
jgi:hypothetical protein